MAQRRPSTMTDLALIAVFAGLTAAFTLSPAVPVGPVGVPITLQTLAVGLTGMALGARRGFSAIALYVVVGLAGLPVFAGGMAGVGILARPSVGYLFSFPFAALLIGFLAQRIVARRVAGTARTVGLLTLAALAARALIITPLGVLGMMVNAKLPLVTALLADLPYWPGDIVKSLVAALVAVAVHRAFPTLLGRPAGTEAAARESTRVA